MYAPTSESSEDDIEKFYDDLERAIAPTPKKDVLILTGDWNAKVGCDNTGWEGVMGHYGYGTRNERGERLLEFAAGHNLLICNTRFQQKPNRKWTWGGLEWHPQEHDRPGTHTTTVEDNGDQLRNIPRCRYQLGPLASIVQHQTTSQTTAHPAKK